jgi:hypothetical protein
MLTRNYKIVASVFLTMVLFACGGGGGGGAVDKMPLVSLEVTPTSATVGVGGTAQYSAVARDSAGLVVATPSLVWVSATSAVGAITSGGLATGLSPGRTDITASAGGVISPKAVFNVVENVACDGIAAVPVWNASLEYLYLDTIKTVKGVDVHADHSASVASRLTLLGPASSNKLNWTGALVGGRKPNGTIPVDNNYVFMFETFRDFVSDPTVDSNLSTPIGDRNPVATPGIDDFRLEVDLSTCTFQFFVTPSAHTKLVVKTHAVNTLPGPDEGERTYTGVFPMGLLQKGSTPLGSWRTNGLGDYSKELPLFASYSVGVTIPANLDGYIPSGIYNQGLFFDLVQPLPRQNTTSMSYGLVPQL